MDLYSFFFICWDRQKHNERTKEKFRCPIIKIEGEGAQKEVKNKEQNKMLFLIDPQFEVINKLKEGQLAKWVRSVTFPHYLQETGRQKECSHFFIPSISNMEKKTSALQDKMINEKEMLQICYVYKSRSSSFYTNLSSYYMY